MMILGTVGIFPVIESSCMDTYAACCHRLPVLFHRRQLHSMRGFIPDSVRVISCGFPAAAAEQEADASACVRLELLMVSVIS